MRQAAATEASAPEKRGNFESEKNMVAGARGGWDAVSVCKNKFLIKMKDLPNLFKAGLP
ncbi:MAG TPA: hypothetical protein VM512_02545 [Burkholderiaceae bacterium]|nr:hypothetical protein [Burkholderiaceae bacterium]